MDDFLRVKKAANLTSYAEAHLEHLGRRLVCPLCGSGKGPKGTPAFSIKDDIWTCFSCKAHGDVFDLAGALKKTDNKAEQLREVAEWAGVDISAGKSDHSKPQEAVSSAKQDSKPQQEHEQENEALRASRDLEAAYIRGTQANIDNPEAVAYLQGRGFSLEEAKAAGIGYDAAKRRIVLPWRGCEWYHIDRATDDAIMPKYTKPPSAKVGRQPSMWKPSNLESRVLFVVEGVFDALAVEACGYSVEPLAGTAWVNLEAELKERKFEGVVVALLDHDEAGSRESEKFAKALNAAGIDCYDAAAAPSDWKDAAELFAKDRDALKDALEWLSDKVQEVAADRKNEEYSRALERLEVHNVYSILDGLAFGRDLEEPVPTGIRPLDEAMNGGLHNGLTVVGAGSSTGKTTLLVQIADYIAASRRPVLFVSVEQSARELVAKSLCRISYEQNGKAYFSATDIYDARVRRTWAEGSKEQKALEAATNFYRQTIASWLLYMSGIGQPRASDVLSAVEHIKERCEIAPVVFIDYVQLLAPAEERMTDKQALDKHITDMRQLANKFSTPVVCVSSINRAAYFGPIEMDSFKESGAVEFGADYALGIQAAGIREAIESRVKGQSAEDAAARHIERDKAAARGQREIVILKARGYRLPPRPVRIDFNGAAQCFEAPKQ